MVYTYVRVFFVFAVGTILTCDTFSSDGCKSLVLAPNTFAILATDFDLYRRCSALNLPCKSFYDAFLSRGEQFFFFFLFRPSHKLSGRKGRTLFDSFGWICAGQACGTTRSSTYISTSKSKCKCKSKSNI